MDFHYLSQPMEIDVQMCIKINTAWKEFHTHKSSVITVGGQQGKGPIINNWYIPELEFLQSVVLSIHTNGIALQWLADRMECTYIEVKKDLLEFANNCDFEPQICQHLNCADKCWQFNITTAYS
jgi:hypothetical protein